MRRVTIRTVSCWLAPALLACGGGAATQPTGGATAESTTPPTNPAPPEEAPAEQPVEDAPAEPEPPPAEPEPAAEPFTASTEDEVRTALQEAASDVAALRRMIDPVVGVGAYDPNVSGIAHYCDMARLSTHQGLGFVIGESDRVRCDRGLRRCSAEDDDGGGYVFLFRDTPGDELILDTLVHYQRRVPRSDSRAVRAFAGAAAGVCGLRRSLADDDGSPPAKLSVFVAGQTGLVPETLVEHHCGDAAAAAFNQRIAPLRAREQASCERNPTRCTFTRGDEEVTVYGDADGPSAVAVTRPRMARNLAQAQERELDAFMRGVRRHSCAD